MKDYEKLRALLVEQEQFPLDFTVKFIGRNSPLFEQGVLSFEADYPSIQKIAERASAKGVHLALTYCYRAQNADEVVLILQRVSRIQDVQMIL